MENTAVALALLLVAVGSALVLMDGDEAIW